MIEMLLYIIYIMKFLNVLLYYYEISRNVFYYLFNVNFISTAMSLLCFQMHSLYTCHTHQVLILPNSDQVRNIESKNAFSFENLIIFVKNFWISFPYFYIYLFYLKSLIYCIFPCSFYFNMKNK